MVKVTSYTKSGNKGTDTNLDSDIFGVKLNPELIAQAYNRYLSNRRTNNAKTLTRGLVAGGGKKPWRQKGTGRARTGSIRNPIWRGGGITFGPTGGENYQKDIPRKMAKLALAQALSAQAKQVKVIEKFAISEYKTKAVLELLTKLSVEGNIVIVVDKTDAITAKSVANIAGVSLITTYDLNVYSVMNADAIIIEAAALDTIGGWLKAGRKKGAAK